MIQDTLSDDVKWLFLFLFTGTGVPPTSAYILMERWAGRQAVENDEKQDHERLYTLETSHPTIAKGLNTWMRKSLAHFWIKYISYKAKRAISEASPIFMEMTRLYERSLIESNHLSGQILSEWMVHRDGLSGLMGCIPTRGMNPTQPVEAKQAEPGSGKARKGRKAKSAAGGKA